MICNISRYFRISYRHISSAFEMTCFLISSSGQLRPWIRSLLCHWHFLRSHVRIIQILDDTLSRFNFIFVPFFTFYFFCVNFIFPFQINICSFFRSLFLLCQLYISVSTLYFSCFNNVSPGFT